MYACISNIKQSLTNRKHCYKIWYSYTPYNIIHVICPVTLLHNFDSTILQECYALQLRNLFGLFNFFGFERH